MRPNGDRVAETLEGDPLKVAVSELLYLVTDCVIEHGYFGRIPPCPGRCPELPRTDSDWATLMPRCRAKATLSTWLSPSS
jgi:hypothetical protein